MAWIAARLFLKDNGLHLRFEKFEAVKLVEDVATGAISEEALAAWFRKRISS